MQVILLTALVGVVGMGLGAAISAIFGNISNRVMCWLLSFAGGVMISVVAFKMIPKGIELSGVWVTVIGLILGITIVATLNHFLNKSAQRREESLERGKEDESHDEEDDGKVGSVHCESDHINGTCEKVHDGSIHHSEDVHSDVHCSETMCCHTDHAKQLICSPALTRSGIILLLALSLHKLPEGIAIGAAGTYHITLGIIVAFTAMLHCLPEGMAIGAPLICGGMSKKKAILLTALGGVPTMIGGAIGVLMGSISDLFLALALTVAAGTMLYVVFGEIIPQSLRITKSRLTTYAAMLGILVGVIAVFVFASPICPHEHHRGGGCDHEHHYYECEVEH